MNEWMNEWMPNLVLYDRWSTMLHTRVCKLSHTQADRWTYSALYAPFIGELLYASFITSLQPTDVSSPKPCFQLATHNACNVHNGWSCSSCVHSVHFVRKVGNVSWRNSHPTQARQSPQLGLRRPLNTGFELPETGE